MTALCMAGLSHQPIPRLAFLLVDVEHLLTEDIFGQHGLDFPDTRRTELSRSIPIRLCHHVNVGKLDIHLTFLIVERVVSISYRFGR